MAGDTIYALSTGSGASGIAVIRLSGPLAGPTLAGLCGKLPVPRYATFGWIRDPDTGERIDSGVFLFFPAPRSFTGEDLAEMQVHGSLAVIRQILSCLSKLGGLRAAEAGEFTHRAFINGKMDLIEVEALGDLLAAETAAQARLARHYQKTLRAAAQRWRASLLSILSLTEAYIDFSDEDDVGKHIDSQAEQEIATLTREIEDALAALATGERIRRGFRIAVLGPPNAGKSSLVNALAAREVAITSTIPGTTRDAIDVHLDLKGLPVILTDTAGLRDSADALENAGILRAQQAAESADLVLWLTPASEKATACPYPDALAVRSKIDLIDSDAARQFPLAISVETGAGLATLIDELHARAHRSLHVGAEAVIVVHERQAAELRSAVEALSRAKASSADALELRAEELRAACRNLDRLTGRIEYDEILGALFSRFCIGK